MVTYSRGIQTTPGSSSISDSEETNENKHLDAGRETEDEMRTRILEEMEVERKALELELQELKQRAEVKTLPGMFRSGTNAKSEICRTNNGRRFLLHRISRHLLKNRAKLYRER